MYRESLFWQLVETAIRNQDQLIWIEGVRFFEDYQLNVDELREKKLVFSFDEFNERMKEENKSKDCGNSGMQREWKRILKFYTLSCPYLVFDREVAKNILNYALTNALNDYGIQSNPDSINSILKEY